MNLITAYEVLKYSPAGSDYPTATFCELIPQIEQEFARECLGTDLFNYLIGKLTPYPSNATEYDSAVSYNVDQVVIRNGCLFVSLTNANSTDPLSATGDWKQFDRFTDTNANSFWAAYLRRILALKVYMASLVYTTWRGGAGGITISEGDGAGSRSGFRAANKGELHDVKTSLIAEIERTTANMRIWIRDNGETAGFPSAFVCGQFCETPGRRSRRWAWKN